ncbi:hypothetical protein [Gilvibacter sediminis]|uniref:hypothetical protein n=1 Tax=Gilvibacter sediminis TaxID=379071 RepID=UPI0023509F7E|nr:hypothetical protein [Gilvibacter sediminis]MDC7996679.1 hypothetical protein [Gilvibacter sediminis]
MKIVYRMSVVLLLSVVIFSCSKEDNTTPENTDVNSELLIVKSTDRASENAFDRFKSVQSEIESKGVPTFPMSRGDFSALYGAAGNPGSLTAKSANMIADQLMVVEEVGFETYILDRTKYSDFAKEAIIKIAAEGYLPELTESEEFASLSEFEQVLLKDINLISKDFSEGLGRSAFTAKTANCTINGQPAPCTATLAVAGAAIGGAICGLPCAVGGGIIGGIIGWFADGGSK